MYTLLIALHVIVAILLIVVILMQSSKGGGLSGAFGGGGGSQALFGGRGASSFLQKVTVGLAVVFMLLAIFINLIGPSRGQQPSAVQQAAQQKELTPGTSLPKPSGSQEGGGGLLPVTPQSQSGQQQTTPPADQSNSGTP